MKLTQDELLSIFKSEHILKVFASGLTDLFFPKENQIIDADKFFVVKKLVRVSLN